MDRRHALIPLTAAALLLTGCASGTATQKAGTPEAVVLRAVLRTGTSGEQGSKLASDAVARNGVAWSNYVPDQGVLVALRTRDQEKQVMGWLSAQPAVVSVTEQL